MQSSISYIEFFSPIRKHVSFTFEGDFYRIALVSILLNQCSPSAVFGRVISVILDSVKTAIIGGAFPHIFQKIVERLKPAFADLYASPTIIFIFPSMAIIASPFHISPCLKFRRITHFMSRIFQSHNFCGFPIKATTRPSCTSPKKARAFFTYISTITTTFPNSALTWYDMGKFYYNQFTETLTDKINNFWHCLIIPFKNKNALKLLCDQNQRLFIPMVSFKAKREKALSSDHIEIYELITKEAI